MGGNVYKIQSKEVWNDINESANANECAIVVDFTASWCGPCRIISPFFEMLSEEYDGIIFASVDVDEMEELAAECEVSAMPTFQVWKDGKKVDELVGAAKERLKELIEKYASSA